MRDGSHSAACVLRLWKKEKAEGARQVGISWLFFPLNVVVPFTRGVAKHYGDVLEERTRWHDLSTEKRKRLKMSFASCLSHIATALSVSTSIPSPFFYFHFFIFFCTTRALLPTLYSSPTVKFVSRRCL